MPKPTPGETCRGTARRTLAAARETPTGLILRLPFPPVETGGYFWGVPTGHGSGCSPGDAKADARRTPQNLVIPGLTRNPVRQSNFKNAELRASGDRRQKFMRRVRAEFYVSGFRVEPAMTNHFFDGGLFFVSPGVGFGVARRSL
jgi:hypothetical protein